MEKITIEVACALPAQQIVLKLKVPVATRLKDAVRMSGILERFPQIDAGRIQLGVFGRAVSPDTLAQPGDRIEIYRDLIADPKIMRRQRVARARKIKAATAG